MNASRGGAHLVAGPSDFCPPPLKTRRAGMVKSEYLRDQLPEDVVAFKDLATFIVDLQQLNFSAGVADDQCFFCGMPADMRCPSCRLPWHMECSSRALSCMGDHGLL
eukprot:11837762-Alexandrium_andersonii.AAC.1